jgi:hypothetical protein
MSIKNGYPQLSVRVTNKLEVDVQPFLDVFGGTINLDRSQTGCYTWSIQARAEIVLIQSFFSYNCRSRKSKRFFLIDEYFHLLDLKAHLIDSPHHTAWLVFLSKWEHRSSESGLLGLRNSPASPNCGL